MTDAPLKSQIHREMTDAMRARDKTTVGTLRMFASAIRYKEDEVGHDLSDEEVREVAAKEVKKRAEAAEAFRGAGRAELADNEDAERAILAAFAPEQLSEAALDALIEETISATGAGSMKEMGTVMGMVMGKAKGRVDGSVVQEKVKARLGG